MQVIKSLFVTFLAAGVLSEELKERDSNNNARSNVFSLQTTSLPPSPSIFASASPVSGFHDDECLFKACEYNEHCRAQGINCYSVTKALYRRRNGALSSPRLSQVSDKSSRRKVIYTSTSIPRVYNVSHIRVLYKRAEHNHVWKTYAPKGFRLFKQLQDHPLEDKVERPMCELDSFFDVTIGQTKALRPRKYTLLEKAGIQATDSYTAVMAVGPKDNSIAEFQNTISAEQGIFLANAKNRGEDKSKGQKPIPHQMSTVAWWMWKHVVMKNAQQGNSADVREEDVDFSNFKYFFRWNINNPDTENILIEALGDDAEPRDFTPEDQSEGNAFWPLLGSPNGNGIAWFLIDHKKSLKGKTISKLTAWRQDTEYHMWATIN